MEAMLSELNAYFDIFLPRWCLGYSEVTSYLYVVNYFTGLACIIQWCITVQFVTQCSLFKYFCESKFFQKAMFYLEPNYILFQSYFFVSNYFTITSWYVQVLYEMYVCVCIQLLNSMLAEEKLGIDGLGALFPVSQVEKCSCIYFAFTKISNNIQNPNLVKWLVKGHMDWEVEIFLPIVAVRSNVEVHSEA